MNTELKGRKKSWGRELNIRLIKAISANKKRHFNNKQYQIDNNIIIYNTHTEKPVYPDTCLT